MGPRVRSEHLPSNNFTHSVRVRQAVRTEPHHTQALALEHACGIHIPYIHANMLYRDDDNDFWFENQFPHKLFTLKAIVSCHTPAIISRAAPWRDVGAMRGGVWCAVCAVCAVAKCLSMAVMMSVWLVMGWCVWGGCACESVCMSV